MKLFLVIIAFLSAQTAFGTDDIFLKLKPNEPSCYGREYSAAHLKSHPKQTVQKIQSKFEIFKYDEPDLESRVMELEVTLKGKKHTYSTYRAFFICFKEDDYCGIECDGGKAQIKLAKNGNIILKNEGFVLEGGCGSEEQKTIFLTAATGGDDKFEMVPLPKEYCQKTSEK